MLTARLRALAASNAALVSFVDQALISGGNFLSGIIAARNLEPADFGLFVIALTIVLETAAIQNALTLQPMIVNGASLSDREFSRFFGAQVVIQACLAVAGASIVLAIAVTWEPLRPIALPLVVASTAFQVQDFCRRVLYTRGAVVQAAANNVVGYDLQAGILVLLAWAGAMSVERVLWVAAGTSTLAVVVGSWQLRRYVSLERDSLLASARESFRLGRWIAGAYALTVASTGVLPALLAAFSSLSSTAGFGVVKQITGPLNLLSRPIENFFLPRATRALYLEGTPAMERVLWQATRVSGPIFVAYVVAVLLGAQWILGKVYGEGYLEHLSSLWVFAIGELVWFPVTVLRLELAARKIQRHLLWVEVWALVVVYGLGLFLIVRLGLMGAALAYLLVNIGGLVITVTTIARERRRVRQGPAMADPVGAAGPLDCVVERTTRPGAGPEVDG